MVHRIRLGPPWEATVEAGRTHWVRRFGRPRRLSPQERVWLVCDALPRKTEVSLNDTNLGVAPGGPLAADITRLLAARNRVVLLTSSATPVGEVALEIRADS